MQLDIGLSHCKFHACTKQVFIPLEHGTSSWYYQDSPQWTADFDAMLFIQIIGDGRIGETLSMNMV
ncbi:hypothetical protein CALCODRAFT_89885 [Calocera cornea HHB12733]|uniref:Uncharacterized protein n=1 Tax=Calocera cornea HHB12733 TaxID=1353952 RepID=A0A165DB78_9BASI|nr:hypothetical protein CALCODRAFT_89885 [Calocera cornea HHB12733]